MQTIGVWKEVTGVQMANNSHIFEVYTSKSKITLKKILDSESYTGERFIIFRYGKIDFEFYTLLDALDIIKTYVVCDDLLVSGYGKHSGRKLWQLPTYLQKQVRKFAGGRVLTNH